MMYVVGYLLTGGVALLFAPEWTMRLLLANTDYGEVMPRVIGMFMTGMGFFVVQIVRYRAEAVYASTIAVRSFFCVCFVLFYFMSRDPFFLTVLVIVGLGLVLTASSYLMDKRAAPAPSAG